MSEPKKLVPLETWAERHFDPPPSLWTLRGLARTGRLRPEAVKVGKAYYVDPDAVVIDPNRRPTLVDRMMHGEAGRGQADCSAPWTTETQIK